MKFFLFALLFFYQVTGFTQVNLTLKRELDSVMVMDQQYRGVLMALSDPSKQDSIANAYNASKDELWNKIASLQGKIDSANLNRIEQIIASYGYPGKSLVGSPTNEAAWYVIQHSDKIGQYLPAIRKAGEKEELPMRLVAMMEDRHLMEQNKEQVYGTQATCRQLKNGKNECFIWPIRDARNVNERRKKAGFSDTVEQNARRMGIEYKKLTMKEVLSIQ